ncbi:Lrp/AsnC family transcriptional regulator [Burkholderia gladioli]|uniref:Lrp/AsnC family transcriptional regulator n=1 Tax=Burkholderia gladioli TaxID=28095 RepID=UPI00163F668B|nr:Lrp/AsnC family transcriptional regulator [Burkholderia gladioli]MBU9320203.1 Lrp/AsnC family transcriptional regulator [Burkholderia gladioli]
MHEPSSEAGGRLDRLDRELLRVLQQQGRISNLELARAVGLSAAQTLRRHRRLVEIGAVRRYESRLDAAMLGFGVTAFVQVKMERGHIRDLATFQKLVAEHTQIQECFSVTGDIDYVLKVVARDLKGLSNFLLDTLMRIPGVSGVQSSVCLDEIKCTSALPLES